MTRARAATLGFRFPRRRRGFWYGLAIDVIWPLLVLGTRMRMDGRSQLPSSGGVLVATNHLSFADPVTVTAFCLAAGRVPRYLAKSELWRVPVLRSVMTGGRHIPVHRGTASAGDAYRDAVASVREGECVVVFPEATFSDHPGEWPVRGKTGIARIALATGAPVVPVANWGTHDVLPAKARLPRFFPRRTVELVAGPPVDLSDLAGPSPTARQLREATDRIMTAVTLLLAEVRQEAPPSSP